MYNALQKELHVISEEDQTSYRETNLSENRQISAYNTRTDKEERKATPKVSSIRELINGQASNQSSSKLVSSTHNSLALQMQAIE